MALQAPNIKSLQPQNKQLLSLMEQVFPPQAVGRAAQKLQLHHLNAEKREGLTRWRAQMTNLGGMSFIAMGRARVMANQAPLRVSASSGVRMTQEISQNDVLGTRQTTGLSLSSVPLQRLRVHSINFCQGAPSSSRGNACLQEAFAHQNRFKVFHTMSVVIYLCCELVY